jgi:hypothetical protein
VIPAACAYRQRLAPLPDELVLPDAGDDEQERNAHHDEDARVHPESLHLPPLQLALRQDVTGGDSTLCPGR